MKKYKHITSGATMQIDKEAPNTLYCTVTSNPNNTTGFKVGDKFKTSPAALKVLYTPIK